MKKSGLLIMVLLALAGTIIVSATIQDEKTNEQTIDELSTVAAETPVKEKPAKDIKQDVRKGKLELDLADKLNKMKPGEKVRVAVWVQADDVQGITVPETDGAQGLSEAEIEEAIKPQLEKLSAAISEKQKPVKNHLKSKKIDILYESAYAPVVFVEASAEEIKDIEALDNVVAIDEGREYDHHINTSSPTVLAPPVWPVVVSGTKVAVVENDGVAFANPYLKDGIYYKSATPNIGYHATGVAGIIASTHPTVTGIAWKGPAILSGNSLTFNDADLVGATDWAVRNGARVLSNSWGTVCSFNGRPLSPVAKYFDYLVYNSRVTVVFSSGNCGTSSYPYNIVSDPATAYNVISVGSFDDVNTGWMWGDDFMSSFSSYVNPNSTHGKREKPEVVAVGSGGIGIISTLTASPWIGKIPGSGAGTSYAAPQVAGEASLLINRTPVLGYWPETVKAIIMASADHNIEGNSRLSDKDGAGGINVLEAYRITTNPTRYTGTYLTYGTGAPWYGQNITASQGQKIRVVIAWDSNSTGYGRSDTLNADLDLYIQRFTGTAWVLELQAGWSTSYDNNFEIVEFNAPASAKYRAMVSKYSWTNRARTEKLGYAAYVK